MKSKNPPEKVEKIFKKNRKLFDSVKIIFKYDFFWFSCIMLPSILTIIET